MKRLLASLIFLMVAGCQAQEPVGYLTLTLPETESAGKYRPSAALSTLAPADVATWTVIVAAEDMDEPIVVEASVTGDRTITIPVKAGPGRIVHVAGRGTPEAGIVQGFDGETVVDVAAEGNTEVAVDVYRSVTVDDATAPMNRYGEETEGASPDVRTMTLVLMKESVDLYTTFAADVDAPWNASREGAIVGTFEFDSDASPRTGEYSRVQSRLARLSELAGADLGETSALGVDLVIDLVPSGEGKIRATVGDEVTAVDANFSGRAMSISVPYALFGDKPKVLRFAGFVSNRSGSTDFVPEKDYVEIALEAVEPAVIEPQATMAFTGTIVQDTGIVESPPAPLLSISSTGDIHLAWQVYYSVFYRYSQDGRVFSPVQSFNSPSAQSLFLRGFDVSASSKRGEGVLVLTMEDSMASTVYFDIYRTSNGAIGKPLNVTPGAYMSVNQYVTDAKAVPFGDGVLVAGAFDMSGIFEGSGGLRYFVNGELIATEFPTLPTSYTTVKGQVLMKTASGAKLLYYLENFDGQTTVYGSVTYTITPTASGFTIGQAQVSDWVAAPTYFMTLDGAATESSMYVALADEGLIDVRTADGSAVTLSGTFNKAFTDFYDPTSAVRMAAAPDGRIGVVWHESPMSSAYAPRLVQLAREPSTNHSIWYAEKLPGAAEFGAPMLVGPGLHADLAFDSQSRPVVAVGHVDYTFDAMYNTADVRGSNISIYRGN